jgi:hypothetical protein
MGDATRCALSQTWISFHFTLEDIECLRIQLSSWVLCKPPPRTSCSILHLPLLVALFNTKDNSVSQLERAASCGYSVRATCRHIQTPRDRRIYSVLRSDHNNTHVPGG